MLSCRVQLLADRRGEHPRRRRGRMNQRFDAVNFSRYFRDFVIFTTFCQFHIGVVGCMHSWTVILEYHLEACLDHLKAYTHGAHLGRPRSASAKSFIILYIGVQTWIS